MVPLTSAELISELYIGTAVDKLPTDRPMQNLPMKIMAGLMAPAVRAAPTRQTRAPPKIDQRREKASQQ
jgi:hypothetical protein